MRRRTARPEELALLEALLREPRGLYEQVATSKVVQRRRHGARYQLTLDYVTVEPVKLPGTITSPWIRVHDADSRRALEFRVRVISGMVAALEGRVEDGGWPRGWRIADEELAALAPLRFPRPPDERIVLAQLREWLGLEPGANPRAADFYAPAHAPPAGAPAAYRRLLAITDGLDVGERRLFGAGDAYVTDIGGAEWWILGETGDAVFLVARPGEEEILEWVHDEPGPQPAAPDLAAYVRRILFRS